MLCAEEGLQEYFYNLETMACGVKLLSQKCFINTPSCHTLSQLPPNQWYGVVWGSLRLSEQFLMYQTSSGPQQSQDKTGALRVPITAILSRAVFLHCKCILKDWQIHLCLVLL